jgi:hypothetical protein
MLDACQPADIVVSLEEMGLAQRFAKLSLQGDRIGLQSAFGQSVDRWSEGVPIP